ncbi:DsbE family thiol:disulfide interchange protein [Devosia naphthalenivorans]|uniref:DsbE family thiol:disulfide interchange protein n=1 Tax=Devosia naphthalenivorans TaxID=2082392 RepID=UPI001964818F|nr:DsbE family thiol:disulfide interchange protein [Devosia naphthalenivorans]
MRPSDQFPRPARRLFLASIPVVVVVGLVGTFAVALNDRSTDLPSVLVNRPAPNFTLPPILATGVPGLGRADLLGQVSVVNVFASWCIPCRDEHPLLVELKERTGVRLFGVNLKDEESNATAFLEELGNPYDAIGADRDGRASIDWGVYGVPETFLVGADGLVLRRHVGPLDRASLDEFVAAIAREKDPR